MKKILVTGGAGFVGSHLCEKLIENGDKVICVDNLKTGSEDNINHLNENFHFIKEDITNNSICKLSKYGIDEIYNLACPASPIHYQSDPIGTTLTCTVGVNNILSLAKETGAKVLQASTSEVYGNPLIHPQTEDYFGNVNPCGIRSCYDEGKRCAESLFFDYYRKYWTKIKVIRIFNTYGERMAENDGRVVSNFILQALHNEDITIYGDGNQTRSFQYVSDLVNGMVKMMNTNDDITGPLNIGNPSEFTINDFANMVIEMTNSKSKIVHLPALSDDPQIRKPNISKAKELLGWEPIISLSEGLEKTIKYFKKHK